MKRLFLFSAFVVFNMLMASCTDDGSVIDKGVTNGAQADDDGGPGHLPLTPPPPPPPPGNGIHP